MDHRQNQKHFYKKTTLKIRYENAIYIVSCSEVNLQTFVYIFKKKMVENQCSQFTSQEVKHNSKFKNNM